MADQQQPQPQEMNVVRAGGLDLLTGFRFHPSDYDIVNHYLTNKVRNRDFTCIAIGEVNLNKIESWDLPRVAKMGKKEWYFFYQKERKYPIGPRVNRATEAGYWKATGKDKEIYKPTEGEGVMLLVGMKKTLVFYKGRAPRGDKTNWVMHEYRLEGSGRLPNPASASSSVANATALKSSASKSKDEWVVCRVFHKTTGIKKTIAPTYQMAMASAEIDQNQNNIPIIPIPMLLQLPLPVPMPMQFPILPDFAMGPVALYYPNPNADTGMLPMMLPMVGIIGTSVLQINGALFGNPMAVPPLMNFYHQMGIGAAAGQMGMGAAAGQMDMWAAAGQMGIGAADQMDMGAASAGGFNVAAPESSPSSMVSQNDEQTNNAAEISSMMPVTGPGSLTTTIEMDGIWKYKY